MLNGKKIIVVLPAYNAEKTLEATYREIPKDIADEILLVDDCSQDKTIEIARKLGIFVVSHKQNLGYGANQKTCYREALKRGADIIIMLHPDYQYPPKLVMPMAALISTGSFDAVLGSRILGGYALKGGMPLYKYISNRLLTFMQNICLGEKLSEYHTGYRAFSREVLLTLPLLENSDDFIFDNEILAQIFYFKFKVGEITSPCSYNSDSSSINFKRSVVYGIRVLVNTLKYMFQRKKIGHYKIFDNKNGKKIELNDD
ncbi:MAG: glycosyltransferase family 2 protein [Candidatus Omnitrophica bacterium]|nr:glycosyltransferase family 2 protein [Candidatus Omnitrophota bacterium]